jgi:hypothetical protein
MRQTWWPNGYDDQGYYYSAIGGGSMNRPAQAPGVDPAPESVPSLFGGSFDQASYAGWISHGGSVGGQILLEAGDGYLRLGPGAAASTATHNRFFLADDAAAIVLDARVITAGAGESLQLDLIDPVGAVFAIGAIPLDAAGGWVRGISLAIDVAVPRAALYTLRLQVVGAAPLEAIAGIDNLAIAIEPALPGDVDGDGCVDVNDLLAVIAAWGACPGCAEDLTGDGAVDVNDLLLVIGAWSPCA